MRKIASRKYRWDLEALRSGKNRLIEEKNNLEENKGVVENLRAEIEENWQSVSSEIYLEELEVDIKDLNFIIKAADELGTLLEKVISQEYGECESKITSKLNNLASSISTCFKILVSGLSVVSHNWSASISPKPLYL